MGGGVLVVITIGTGLKRMSVDFERATTKDYETLGVSPTTPYPEVKKAYRTLVKLWHPDRFQQQSSARRLDAEERLKAITGAYHRVAKEHVLRERIRQAAEATLNDADRAAWERTAYRSAPAGRAPGPSAPSVSAGSRPRRSRFVWLLVSSLAVLLLLVMAIPLAWMPFLSIFGDSSPEKDMAAVRRFWESPPREAPPEVETPTPSHRGVRERPGRARHDKRAGRRALPGTFSIGSSQSEVYRIQGAPTRVHGQTWVYGLSEVQFRDGLVTRYDNFDGSLLVSMPAGGETPPESPEFFSLGSTQDEVLLVQGAPTRVDGGRWYFGFSQVRFKDGRVEDFDNYFGNLRVRMLPSTDSPGAQTEYFTIGSTRDQVLAVQGTPTKVQGGLWFYHFSNIQFREGKVAQVVNSDGNLRFNPPGETYRTDDRS